MTEGIELGPGAEFDLIRTMRLRLGPLAVGLGDDAAVLSAPRGEQVVLSVDAAIEGVHFRRDWLSLREIGYRAITAALSDLAAMAATPLGVLVALTLPGDDSGRDGSMAGELADGIGEAVKAASTVVIGGNVARGELLALNTTVVGSAFSPLRRSGARPGDFLYVTGALGAPATALRAFEKSEHPSQPVRARLAHPAARLAEARWLAARGAMAAIDISDGLAGDAKHLAAASSVDMEIQIERVPVFDGATKDDALSGGDEYELLVAARAPFSEDDFVERFSLPLTLVGRVVEGAGEVRFTHGGARVAPPPGYDHFTR
jgi:thiamine-monophosphate kinase